MSTIAFEFVSNSSVFITSQETSTDTDRWIPLTPPQKKKKNK